MQASASAPTATIVNCTFERNRADLRGVVYINNAPLELRNGVFRQNQTIQGGAVFVRRDLRLVHCYFVDNRAIPTVAGSTSLDCVIRR